MRSDAGCLQLAIRAAFLCCMICCVTDVATAQTGQLAGVVRDSSGAIVQGASLELLNIATGLKRETVTDQSGSYVLPAIPPGQYILRTKKTGFAVAETAVQVEVALSASQYNIILYPAKVDESVDVSTAPILQSRDGSVSTVIDRRFAENIPLNGRSFHALLELAPGVVPTPGGGFATNGQRPGSAYFTVDGVSANAGVAVTSVQRTNAAPGQVPSASIVGGWNAMVSVDALQEFRVQTSSFAAEYGRTPGAQVSIVTRAGTNQLHGSLFDQIRNDALDATNWFYNNRGAEKPPLRQNDFGGTLGGAILQNRLFFFGSFESLRLDQPTVQALTVPETWLRAAAAQPLRDLLELLPLPTGPENGDLLADYILNDADPTSSDVYGLRLDFNQSSRTMLMGRMGVVPAKKSARTPTVAIESDSRLKNGTFGVTHIFNERVVGDLKVGYSSTRFKTQSVALRQSEFEDIALRDWLPLDTPSEQVLFSVRLGNSTISSGPSALNAQQQYNVVGSLTTQLRRHVIKFGVDYRQIKQFASSAPVSIGLDFRGLSNLLSGIPAVAAATYQTPVRGTLRNTSLYAQDTWQILTPLTVTFGLRWDYNPTPSFAPNETPLAVTTVNPIDQIAFREPGTDLWDSGKGRLAPRVGASWAVDKASRLVVSGGFGLFYDPAAEAAGQVFLSGLFPQTQQTLHTLPSIPPSPEVRRAWGSVPTLNLTPPFNGPVTVVDPALVMPATKHWNVKLEGQLGTSDSVSLGYVGSRGDQLLSTVSFLKPNADFPAAVGVVSNLGRSRYKALQFEYRRRAVGGLQTQVSYTLGKAQDNISALVRATQDLLNLGGDRLSPSDFDVRHVLTAAVSWNLPSPSSGAKRALFGHWSVDVLGRMRSGYPFTVVTGRMLGDVTNITELPNVVDGEPMFIFDDALPWGRKVNSKAFSLPAAGQQGNHRRNSLRGPSARQVDLGIRKAFYVGRGVRAQLRVDAFNVLNVVNFANPSSSLSEGGFFGAIRNTLDTYLSGAGTSGALSSLYQWGGARSLEIGVRLDF